jgi:TetR/AcrR family transcriptional regulator, transcriptional repressor for nem operon
MRRSKAEKQRTHMRIVQEAARQFRAAGIQGIGIADLMRQVDLTHGGFYAHFKNKEALVAEVCREGLAETEAYFIQAAQKAPPGAELAAIIDFYLAAYHRDHPALGCVMPTLGGEIARHSAEVRTAFTQGYQRLLQQLLPWLMKGAPKEQAPKEQAAEEQAAEEQAAEQEEVAMALLSGLVGSLLLARAVNDPALSERILRSNRAFYQQAFAR